VNVADRVNLFVKCDLASPHHSTLRLKRTFLVLQANCASSLAHLSHLIPPLHNLFFFSILISLIGCREVIDIAKSYRTNNVFLFFGSDFKCDYAMPAVSFSSSLLGG
jgi:hypothetical protein